MKICKHCKIEKPDTDFKYNDSTRDHLSPTCKYCEHLHRIERQKDRKPDPTITSKTCCRCKKEQNVNNFALNKSVKDGYDGWCRDCVKDASLQRKYNITLEEYNQILIDQDYKCAICGTIDPKGNRGVFVVDHDHRTGRVRGLLCNHCNTGLGKLGDTIEALQKAIEYLQNQETNIV